MRNYPTQSFVEIGPHSQSGILGSRFCNGSGRRTIIEGVKFDKDGQVRLTNGCGFEGCTNSHVIVTLNPAVKAYRR